jgi:hypothetical protein
MTALVRYPMSMRSERFGMTKYLDGKINRTWIQLTIGPSYPRTLVPS